MGRRQQALEQAVAALEARHGRGVIRRARDMSPGAPHLTTGFPLLDALTGCGGIPLGAMTLLTGPATSGKVTVAYKSLAAAQQRYPTQTVALLDLHAAADPDYLARAGVDLARLLLVRPPLERAAVDVLVDLAQSRKVRLLVVNSLADLQAVHPIYRYLNATLGHLQQALRATHSALIWLDDPTPPWLRWFNLDAAKSVRQFAALQVELQWEHWVTSHAGELRGYGARAKLHKSRWTRPGRSTTLAIEFNGTIKARATW